MAAAMASDTLSAIEKDIADIKESELKICGFAKKERPGVVKYYSTDSLGLLLNFGYDLIMSRPCKSGDVHSKDHRVCCAGNDLVPLLGHEIWNDMIVETKYIKRTIQNGHWENFLWYPRTEPYLRLYAKLGAPELFSKPGKLTEESVVEWIANNPLARFGLT